MVTETRQIVLARLPKGELEPSHFDMQTVQTPALGDGEIVVKTLYMSLDAANRAWMQGATYRDAVEGGDPMPTLTIGRVEQSNDASVPVGSVVETEGVWADYIVAKAKHAKVVPDVQPLSHRLSVQGIAGKTA